MVSRVSIHAPAWGATHGTRPPGLRILFQSTRPHGARQCRQSRKTRRCSFNPRARMGRDLNRQRRVTMITFQSTRPHGARPDECIRIPAGEGFNPRARMGRDFCGQRLFHFRHVSIHAPAWGATLYIAYPDNPVQFQSTRPHGARPSLSTTYGATVWFQSTRPHGARLRFGIQLPRSDSFNPRARMGRDFGVIAPRSTIAVSIHAPAWGATHGA